MHLNRFIILSSNAVRWVEIHGTPHPYTNIRGVEKSQGLDELDGHRPLFHFIILLPISPLPPKAAYEFVESTTGQELRPEMSCWERVAIVMLTQDDPVVRNYTYL